MPLTLEDYAVVGDRRTVAVVGRDASVDWLCLPRVDSGAVFTALLGTPQRWSLTVEGGAVPAGRRYVEGTMVLVTELACAAGVLRVTDTMPLEDGPQLIRELTVQGRSVDVESAVDLGFETGERVPLWRGTAAGLEAVSGQDAVVLDGDVRHEVQDGVARAVVRVTPGRPVRLRLGWRGWDRPPVLRRDAKERTVAQWQEWISRSTYRGEHRDAVERSLLVLQSLTNGQTGGIVAAATTSLPERPGGTRNWDYRFCWLRDATFTLLALLESGYVSEAAAWREWLLRVVGGRSQDLQIAYSVDGSPCPAERTVELPGYDAARPVRIGNAAADQLQLDVYGEVLDAFHQARQQQLQPEREAWELQRQLMEALEGEWKSPDRGIWEIRAEPQHFVHSKVMAWVAADRAVRTLETRDWDGPLDRWRDLRRRIHDEVCEQGFDVERGTFVMAYGSKALDAATLRIPAVGFLPPRDPRVLGTIDAVTRELDDHGLLRRYVDDVDGLPVGEGCFLPCSFWLADALALAGRPRQARDLYERLLALRNDVGLLTEEYDGTHGKALGNLPQALSHVPVVNTAHLLVGGGAARTRSR